MKGEFTLVTHAHTLGRSPAASQRPFRQVCVSAVLRDRSAAEQMARLYLARFAGFYSPLWQLEAG